jgi:hypothetical protein
MTLLRLAWPPSLTVTCFTVIFCWPPGRAWRVCDASDASGCCRYSGAVGSDERAPGRDSRCFDFLDVSSAVTRLFSVGCEPERLTIYSPYAATCRSACSAPANTHCMPGAAVVFSVGPPIPSLSPALAIMLPKIPSEPGLRARGRGRCPAPPIRRRRVESYSLGGGRRQPPLPPT